MRLLALAAVIATLGGAHLLGVGQASGPIARLGFDGDGGGLAGGQVSFTTGLNGQALHVAPDTGVPRLTQGNDDLALGSRDDFSVQFWVRTDADADRQMVLLSQKPFVDTSLASQKQSGWVFYVSAGTWAWKDAVLGLRRSRTSVEL